MPDVLLLIAGIGIVTYIPRFLPLPLLSTRKLPQALIRWLEAIPAAVLSALLAPSLLLTKKGDSFHLAVFSDNIFLLAAIPTALVAWFGKSFFGTVFVGMGTVALLRLWLC